MATSLCEVPFICPLTNLRGVKRRLRIKSGTGMAWKGYVTSYGWTCVTVPWLKSRGLNGLKLSLEAISLCGTRGSGFGSTYRSNVARSKGLNGVQHGVLEFGCCGNSVMKASSMKTSLCLLDQL